MSFTIRTTGSDSGATIADPYTATLGVTTNTGDCVILVIGINASGTATLAGLGATWVQLTTTGTGPEMFVYLGYNCSAGNTTFTVSGLSGHNYGICWALVGGVKSSANPLIGSQTAHTASGTTLSTPSLSYGATDFVFGAACTGGGGPAINGGTWSDGNTNSVITGNGGGASGKPVELDRDPITTASSTTYTETLTGGGSGINVFVANLAAAPAAATANGNFLALMGV